MLSFVSHSVRRDYAQSSPYSIYIIIIITTIIIVIIVVIVIIWINVKCVAILVLSKPATTPHPFSLYVRMDFILRF